MSTTTEDETGVYIGGTGYLFLSGGRHSVFPYFTGGANPKPRSVRNFADNLRQRSEYCVKTGRHFTTVVFPEKCVALRNELKEVGTFQSLFERSYLPELVDAGLMHSVCYPLSQFQDNSAAFFRTDTHYSAPGCLLMTEAILGSAFPEIIADGMRELRALLKDKPGFSGDLGRKFDPPHVETARVLDQQKLQIDMATNGVKGGNDGICILVSSSRSLTDKTVLIFGDSFFRQLLPLLAVFYRRVIFCRTRYFHYELTDAFSPDHIFCGLAERYLSGCLPDKKRPHFLSYPIELGRSMNPDEGFTQLWAEFCDRRKLVR